MNKFFSYMLIMGLLLNIPLVSQAAFQIKKQPVKCSILAVNNADAQVGTVRHNNRFIPFLKSNDARIFKLYNIDNPDDGWEGIVAFICCLTFFLAPAAIVFGAMGKHKNHRFWKLATIGFVVGIVETAWMLFVLALFIALYV